MTATGRCRWMFCILCSLLAASLGCQQRPTERITLSGGSLGGACSLEARWTISRKGQQAPVSAGKSSHTEPAGESYAALVSAQSRLLAALG